ncbi:HET-domain-containing protein [Ophiobolus disseminans]|uniref:HET-domain-containing protein n=1 Tax=Ophiobolus disseminans TaxID=1469910 RepID=A0A6A7AE75_9PLEO|nr:HET-domain-containing protein [Ophiobolus disseminans]
MELLLYQPLAVPTEAIRVVDLEPSHDSKAPIQCSLRVVTLDDGLSFEALSYTWGHPEPQKVISLNDCDFEAQENLEAALRRLRRTNDIRTLWIDALCINQRDRAEKSVQVSRMGEIYERAQQVVVWLGEPGDDEIWMGEVSRLLDRPYFSRCWIQQEVVLANKITVVCDDSTGFEGHRKVLVHNGTLGLRHYGTSINVFLLLDSLRSAKEAATLPSIYKLLFSNRHLSCTNARDRVYAFMNLIKVDDKAIFTVDYSISTSQVYIEAARAMMRAHGNLNILNCARALPTQGKNQKTAQSLEHAQGNARVLVVRGVVYDTIDELGDTWHPETALEPLSRYSIEALENWEKMIVSTDKTTVSTTDFWRMQIAAYAGDGAAPENTWLFYEAWRNRPDLIDVAKVGSATPLWGPTIADVEKSKQGRRAWSALNGFWNGISKENFEGHELLQRYRDFRARLIRACAHRAMFISAKGHIGLAPWNAREGDRICILLGGCTPFLLRPVGGESKQYTLEGESYVHGLMAGEVFNAKEGVEIEAIEII